MRTFIVAFAVVGVGAQNDRAIGGGACTNAGDQQKWTTKGKANLYMDMWGCGNNNNYEEAGSTTCMILQNHYSITCAGCFGAAVSCMGEHCLHKCTYGATEACRQCVASNCTAALTTCSGLTPPTPAESFACADTADQQVWTSKGKANFDTDMTSCGHSSLGDKDKATTCMKDMDGYSDTCAGCFGATISCARERCNCNGGETEACKQCVASECTPALTICSGLTPSTPAITFVGSTDILV